METKKALVVDDSKLARLTLGRMLEKRAFAVEEAASGEEALAKVQQDKPDVIFMDVLMPGIDGYQAAKAITQDPETGDVPVVMCTSKDSEEDRARAREVGAAAFMVKPVSEEGLDKALAHIHAHRMEKEVEHMLESSTQEEMEQAVKEAVERIADQVIKETAQRAVEDFLRRQGHMLMLETLKGVREGLKKEIEAHALHFLREQGAHFLASEAVKHYVTQVVQESAASILQRETLTLRQSAEGAARQAAHQAAEEVAHEAAERALKTSLAPLKRGLWVMGGGLLLVVAYLILLAAGGIYPHLWP